MEFLEVLTEGLERVLMVRGSGREVITIYSWSVRRSGIDAAASRKQSSSLLLSDLNAITLRNTLLLCHCLRSHLRRALWVIWEEEEKKRRKIRRRQTLMKTIITTVVRHRHRTWRARHRSRFIARARDERSSDDKAKSDARKDKFPLDWISGHRSAALTCTYRIRASDQVRSGQVRLVGAAR